MDVVSTVNKIWPQINGQVTGYFSTAIFNLLLLQSSPTQTGAIAIGLSLIYFVIEPIIRKPIEKFKNDNEIWNKVLDELGNVTYRFFLFIIIQYTNLYISRQLNDTISNMSFFQRVVEMLVISFVLVYVVSVLEYFGEIMQDQDDYISYSIKNFNRAYSGIYGVVIQFFASSFFSILQNLASPRNIMIGSLVFFLCYLVFENLARMVIKYSDPDQLNRPVWDKTLMGYLDFFYTFSVFILVQYIGIFITGQLSNNISIFGELTATFTIFVVFYTAMAMIVDLTKYMNREDSWFITDTTFRIWPRISGTVTGLIASLISDRLLVTESERKILLYLVLTILIYSFFDSYFRKILKYLQSPEEQNSTWNSVVIELLDFYFSLGLLLFLNNFTDFIGIEDRDLFEAISLTISSQAILSTILVIFKEYDIKDDSEEIDQVSKKK